MAGADGVRDALAEYLPGYPVRSVRPLGAGLDHVAYDVNGELIVRFSRDPDPARVRREARLLAALAGIASLPVPAPRFVAPERGCLAYPRLPGRPLLDLPGSWRHARAVPVAGVLGRFLAGLHATPVERMAALVPTEDEPPARWLAEAAAEYRVVADRVPAGYRRRIEAFLGDRPPDRAPALAFSHNDLGVEHVLVDPGSGTVTGVIDWTDAAVVDPAYDLGLLLRDLGPAALDAALRAYGGGSAATRERATFYARCAVLEDLGYGLAANRAAYTDKSIEALRWLFTP